MKGMSFRTWRVLAEAKGELWFDLGKMTRPSYVGKKETPENIDAMTMGQMLKLSSVADGWSVFFEVCKELMQMTEKEVDEANAAEVVRFVGWAVAELKKLNDRFARVRSSRTKEEKQAGIERLKFGPFGLVDWYAQRMGIANHDDVMEVPALRVWQCMMMDNETREFEKRLAKVYREQRK